MKITDEKTLETIDRIFAKLRKELAIELQRAEPLPEPPAMSIGDEAIINGYKAKVIGYDDKPLREGEWWYNNGDDSWNIKLTPQSKVAKPHFKAIITDQKYWTGTIMGEKVRCYEGRNGKVEIRFTDTSHITIMIDTDYKRWYINICECKLWLSTIKSAGIPIMPHWMLELQGGMKAPKSEE